MKTENEWDNKKPTTGMRIFFEGEWPVPPRFVETPNRRGNIIGTTKSGDIPIVIVRFDGDDRDSHIVNSDFRARAKEITE